MTKNSVALDVSDKTTIRDRLKRDLAYLQTLNVPPERFLAARLARSAFMRAARESQELADLDFGGAQATG